MNGSLLPTTQEKLLNIEAPRTSVIQLSSHSLVLPSTTPSRALHFLRVLQKNPIFILPPSLVSLHILFPLPGALPTPKILWLLLFLQGFLELSHPPEGLSGCPSSSVAGWGPLLVLQPALCLSPITAPIASYCNHEPICLPHQAAQKVCFLSLE